MANKRILGIDPGYDRCGFALLEKDARGKESLLFSECFLTKKSLPFSERLRLVGERFESLIREHAPHMAAMEKLYFENNQKSAMAVSEVRGALLYIAAGHSLPFYEYTPLQVKAAVTGYGRSDKKQVAGMVGKLLRLSSSPRLDDEYDAIALALTASASVKA
ncbi:MAG TPA: crossover junction endodeoxyribonuclease RuvC [Candidatus Paceibacterota bacterium]|nr:crossover junction endodeoxyribonuclease RuvC [Candidatus Paceibacterota bacterium]